MVSLRMKIWIVLLQVLLLIIHFTIDWNGSGNDDDNESHASI